MTRREDSRRVEGVGDAAQYLIDWSELSDASNADLGADLAPVLASMTEIGLPRAYRLDRSLPDTPLAVVKVFGPGTLLTIPA